MANPAQEGLPTGFIAHGVLLCTMPDAGSCDSPLESVANAVGESTIEAIKILGDETRLAILVALWEAQNPGSPSPEQNEPGLAFSELYDRVGYEDTGNFNYHLGKLVGPFVRETDEGYALTTRAERVLHAMLAGTLTDPPSFEGEPIDASCYRCGSQVVVDYIDTRFVRRCTSCEGIWRRPDWPRGTLVGGYRPPIALRNRTPQEFNRHGNLRDRHRRASMMEGVCPDCSGTVSTTIHVCDEHDIDDDTVCGDCGSLWNIQTTFLCDVCKLTWSTPAWGPIFTNVAVLAFFHDHGLDPRSLFDVSFYAAENRELFDAIERVSVRSSDPLELVVSVALDGDRLAVALDGEGSIVDVIEQA